MPKGRAFGPQPLSDVLQAFAAGREVPGSGSANALAAALAACLTASVAAKTHHSNSIKYINVKQTAADVERRARSLALELQELLEHDSAVFAPVVAIRRETGKESDVIRQDNALRKEVAALKPATDIPVRIAQLAIQVGELAVLMLKSGFEPARGESFTALTRAIGAVDGALYVARLNVRTIRLRANKLNDPRLEAPWIEMMLRRIGSIRNAVKVLRLRASLADKALDETISTPRSRRRSRSAAS